MTSATEMKLMKPKGKKTQLGRIRLFTTKIKKSLPDLSRGQENNANFLEDTSSNDNDAQNSSKKGDEIIVLKYLKAMIKTKI